MACLFPGVRFPVPRYYPNGAVVTIGDFFRGKVNNGAVVAFGEQSELLAKSLHRSVSDLTSVPCGKCIRCKLRVRKEMSLRLHKESESYPHQTLFFTFTYDEEHVPWGAKACPSEITGEVDIVRARSLRAADMRTFFKDLRSWYDYHYPKETGIDFVPTLRQYHCGEYGPQTLRPHYHAILYGVDPLFLNSVGRVTTWDSRRHLFESDIISEKWGKGRVVFGEASFEGMQYVAGYVVKKKIPRDERSEVELFWNARDMEARTVHASNGMEYSEFLETRTTFRGMDVPFRPPCMVEPEFAHGSNRPGIAHDWYEQHKDEIYAQDEMFLNGKKVKPCSYFDRLFDLEHRDPDHPDLPSHYMRGIKTKRRERAAELHELTLKQTNMNEKQYQEHQIHVADPVASRIMKYRDEF